MQEYVLMDERVVMDGDNGERFLIPVPEDLSASAIALVEPWACVEDSYVNTERQTIKTGGKLLIVADGNDPPEFESSEIARRTNPRRSCASTRRRRPSSANETFDDIIYFGADKKTIETLNDKLAPQGDHQHRPGRQGNRAGGLGRHRRRALRHDALDRHDRIERGRLLSQHSRHRRIATQRHRRGRSGQADRWARCTSSAPRAAACRVSASSAPTWTIPASKPCAAKAQPLADANACPMQLINTQKQPLVGKFSYWALMAPVGALVAAAVRDSLPGALINIFAGIPAPTKQDLDLDTYIANSCYMFGTSGSVIRDMKIVLDKVERQA